MELGDTSHEALTELKPARSTSMMGEDPRQVCSMRALIFVRYNVVHRLFFRCSFLVGMITQS